MAVPEPRIAEVRDQPKSYHIRSFILNFLAWISILGVIFSDSDDNNSIKDGDDDAETVWFGLAFFFLLIYFIDCCCSGTGRYLMNH
mmetsp:Transcript_106786/g.148839  ORF Transcript_106786/g.148839 Transcript_106786/m.148839 type:complete len:86 (+) Transcript_106786:46-303(+)